VDEVSQAGLPACDVRPLPSQGSAAVVLCAHLQAHAGEVQGSRCLAHAGPPLVKGPGVLEAEVCLLEDLALDAVPAGQVCPAPGPVECVADADCTDHAEQEQQECQACEQPEDRHGCGAPHCEHEETQAGEHQRCAVRDYGHLSLAHAQGQEPVVEVAAVRGHDASAVQEPAEHAQERVEDRDAQDQDGQAQADQGLGLGCCQD